MKDARKEDFIGLLIDLPCAPDCLGLEVLATMPALPTDFAEIKIQLRQWTSQCWGDVQPASRGVALLFFPPYTPTIICTSFSLISRYDHKFEPN